MPALRILEEEGALINLTGSLNGLKPAQLDRLRRLFRRRFPAEQLMTGEFARELSELSHDISRQIGVLADRRGRIDHVMVGDDRRIFIPELERGGAARLRELRLIHTHLKKEPLSEEDLFDLTLLRLDTVTAITVDQRGLPEFFYTARLSPSAKTGYELFEPVRPGQEQEAFDILVEQIEREFRQSRDKTRKASGGPRAYLVGLYTPEMRRKRMPDESMDELEELCRTAGVNPVRRFVQNRQKADPATVVGSGKIRDLSVAAVQDEIDLMIFDRELAPSQAIRISRETSLKIIDRTQLILDIFAQNARSRDGKLQVELAQLRYLKGRLSETDDNMSRLTGGIGARGPGETKLEIGRRRVEEKIGRLEKELKSLKGRRELLRSRRNRSGVPVCSIVGYTNAGKSTLLNALTRSEVIAENRLFATLDPTTRRLRFPEERELILSDTVGFIYDLPPELERAFEATLEELGDSDLLLHCIDAADPLREQKIRDVESILLHLGLDEIPVLRVYNKIDRMGEEQKGELMAAAPVDSVFVSAQKGLGFEDLLLIMERRLFDHGTEGAAVAKKEGRAKKAAVQETVKSATKEDEARG